MVSEAEDITDKLSEYGTLDEEEIRSIKENGKKKEQQIQRMKSEQGNGQTEQTPAAFIQQESVKDDGDTAEIKKFVICPSCGEKIWL